MLLDALILVFISAILHVSWNVMVQKEQDPFAISSKAVLFGTLVYTPFIFCVWIWSKTPVILPLAFFYAFLSGLAELLYFLFLSHSYKHGELSVVYPIARGSAPVISVFLGLFLLHEHIDHIQIIGIGLLLLGIWLVRQTQMHMGRGIITAFLTGVFIAVYTVIDKVGLQYTNALYYGELKYVFTSLALLAYLLIIKQPTQKHTQQKSKPPFLKIAIVGVFIILAYQLVLFALAISPVAIISPLRESASVVVTAWGIWKLKEREGMVYKILGVCFIFIGIILLAF